MASLDGLKMDDGRYQSYAFPGGYPLYYMTRDGGILCPDCVNGGNGSLAYIGTSPDGIQDKQWEVIEAEANYEDEDMQCDHCNRPIESAYGE